MTYDMKIDRIIEDCDSIIVEYLDKYDTSDLEEIVLGLVNNHTFTSADSIQSLIYSLEKLMDYYSRKN